MAETSASTANDVEVVQAIRTLTNQILQEPETAHEFTRDAIVSLDAGIELAINQLKHASPVEQLTLRTVGATAFADQAWFEAVSMDLDAQNYNDLHLWATAYDPSATTSLFSDSFASRERFGAGPWQQELHDPRDMSVVKVDFSNPEDLAARDELIQWHLGQLAVDPTITYRTVRSYIFGEQVPKGFVRAQGSPLVLAKYTQLRKGSAPAGDGMQTGDMMLQVVDHTTSEGSAILGLLANGDTTLETFEDSMDEFRVRTIPPDERTERLATILAKLQEKVA